MDEIELINIFRIQGNSDKKTVIKPLAFSFSAAILSHLSHSWPGLNYMCKAKHKTFENE